MLETKRLILRAWKDSDRAPYAALNADPKVMKYMPGILSAQETDELISRIRTDFDLNGLAPYAVELKATGEFIGSLGLAKTNFDAPFTPAVEIGWRLAYPYWNQGYTTEGALRVIMHAFEELDIPEIVSFTTKDNAASQRVMDKLGMTYERGGNFMHPGLPPDHKLALHVLYRLKR
jgi:RimJ/RimL family protein N-acetyltransferase